MDENLRVNVVSFRNVLNVVANILNLFLAVETLQHLLIVVEQGVEGCPLVLRGEFIALITAGLDGTRRASITGLRRGRRGCYSCRGSW